ncbi:uncharacterized protein DSM5745_04223 [Aspergillus mulundensis]|uniref:Uncharacterized protein n=1 Tax=Aspergillus mulundensis TaxID=1810919 RepID=A0A3D8SC21_9EURO|nr:Uncharacterized protein DSM5745_04223 [Aspergillus mulundensis]RDW83897.1 Uncharacterized protein DSM5745_04223 [Aspergillus mulundensis]
MVLNHLTAPVLTTAAHGPQSTSNAKQEPCDPNIPDHRLSINRPCIYERCLPGNAYITAHVQRLQHGHYATAAVSDRDIDCVDFLAVSFAFHSPDTRNHRFKAATIRASLNYPTFSYGSSNDKSSVSTSSSRSTPNHPHFLKHAPHFLHGSIIPETMQWNYSLSGSLGVSQLPLLASLSPAAGLNGRFNRYEMMRIQGSVRSKDGIPATQIVWTLEENTLQHSGLPREFTFAMLIAKPGAESRVQFVLEIEPVLQCWLLGNYPAWWVKLWRRYRAVRRKRGVDFRISVGQRFGVDSKPKSHSHSHSGPSRRGFNFAKLVTGLDEYVSMSGGKVVAAAGGSSAAQGQPDSPDPMPLPSPIQDPGPDPMPMPFPGGQDGAHYPFPPHPGYGYGGEPRHVPEYKRWPRTRHTASHPRHPASHPRHPAQMSPRANDRIRERSGIESKPNFAETPHVPARTSSNGQGSTQTQRTKTRRGHR